MRGIPNRSLLPIALAMAVIVTAEGSSQRPTHGRLFEPEELGILESPDRDDWQQPDRIMDALLIREGSRVADLGAGGGWFTIRLARRVGPNGRVYAHDIQTLMIESIRRRVDDQGLKDRVETRLGAADDPRLVRPLDAVLIVDAYSEIAAPVTVLRHIARALADNGRLGIVEFKRDGPGGPGPPLDRRMDPAEIRREAFEAGLTFLREESLRYQYVLIFGRGAIGKPGAARR